MKKLTLILLVIGLGISFNGFSQVRDEAKAVDGQWSVKKINEWYEQQPWLVGCNYYPATAINQIEMWQASTWDPKTIDKELGMAEEIGMNTLRVYLHDLVYEDDKMGLYKRMDEFLGICQRHGIRPFFVFFDDCHFPNPQLGEQPLTVSGYHNSGWVNSPARDLALRYSKGEASKKEIAHLKGYIQETLSHFKDDERILMWELYNEPGRGSGENGNMAGQNGGKSSMGDKSRHLVYDSWGWAREINPSQPITSNSAGSVGKANTQINRVNSDIHSIHSYSNAENLRKIILDYKSDGRPVVVTEWLARTNKSEVATCLPVMKELNVGAVNWGFVSGKTGTVWPWSSRNINGKRLNVAELRAEGKTVSPKGPFPEPEVWFHDLFRLDGTPYDPKEIKVFKKLTKQP